MLTCTDMNELVLFEFALAFLSLDPKRPSIVTLGSPDWAFQTGYNNHKRTVLPPNVPISHQEQGANLLEHKESSPIPRPGSAGRRLFSPSTPITHILGTLGSFAPTASGLPQQRSRQTVYGTIGINPGLVCRAVGRSVVCVIGDACGARSLVPHHQKRPPR